MNFDSRRRYFRDWPRLAPNQAEGAILIYDRRVAKVAAALIRQFPRRVGVRAGEDLKSFASAEIILQKLLRLSRDVRRDRLRIYILGGGSVGDFAGFCASVLRRGTPVVQIPSTWLAAVDSAHGGKTALNLAGAKNQIGTYWPADEVWLIEPLLIAQPAARAREARGEVYKSAVIAGGQLFRRAPLSETPWPLLRQIIDTKMKIVRADPRENRGRRHILNLGHTIGHVLESARGLPHGTAVLYGLAFAVEWRRHEELMRGNFRPVDWIESVRRWPDWPSPEKLRRELSSVRDWRRRLSSDKKSLGDGRVRFVFPRAPGRVEVQTRAMDEVLAELQRQMQ